MKIIFDSEEERDKFLMGMAHWDHVCPSDFGLKDIQTSKCEDCDTPSCEECWKECGLDIEVTRTINGYIERIITI